ncbi:hypothetical protein ACFY20_41290 [Streptomyces sp. NPDC001312]|uniref:hypothetical protein n=1 Tax=Streptomyces sp. NPDC001312 TaxID=3364561 RepID=UPI0036CE9D6A
MDTTRTDNSDETVERDAMEAVVRGNLASEAATDDAVTEKTADTADVRVESAPEGLTGDGVALDEDVREDDDAADADAAAAAERSASGLLFGAAAVAAAGLGLASLTGTWVSTVMSARQQLIGQIESQSSSPANQIAAIYGDPWHTTALVNGVFALIAVVVAVAVLLWHKPVSGRGDVAWVKAVAWGAVALGVIGLLIAGAVEVNLFTSLPSVPATAPGAGGSTG